MASSGPDREPETGAAAPLADDAMERTQLAGERTFLAWWRTGMTALAVSIGAGRVVPAVAGGPQLAYTLDGLLFAGLGVFILVYARIRGREVDEAAEQGRYRRPHDWVLGVVTGAAALGGLLLGVLVAIGR